MIRFVRTAALAVVVVATIGLGAAATSATLWVEHLRRHHGPHGPDWRW